MPHITPTHLLRATASGPVSCAVDGDCPPGYHCEDGECVDDYGSPASGEHDTIGGSAGIVVAARFMPTGAGIDSGLIRTAAGERVERTPMIEVAADLSTVLSPGDTLALEPLAGEYHAYDDLEAAAVNEVYDGRHARPRKTTIELEQN